MHWGGVPKGHDDFRAIVDCSKPRDICVNQYTDQCTAKFGYNSVECITVFLPQGGFLSTIDISNAYRAVNIHPKCRERQGLAWDFGSGLVYLRDNRLCMGLSSSPYVFSKISDFIVRCLAREGFDSCVNYLDDFCVFSGNRVSCEAAQLRLITILRRIGFYISFKKLTPPAQVTRFLGIEVDAVEMELRLPADKLLKLRDQLGKFLARKKATKRELEMLGGILAHCCKVVHGGRTFSRRVYDLIASVDRSWHMVRLNAEFRLDVKWWLDFAADFNGKAKIIPSLEPWICIYSDASLLGFGALFENDWVAGPFPSNGGNLDRKWLGHHFAEAGDEGCDTENINVLEMWPIVVAMERWSGSWANRTVVMITDNTQVRAAINTGRSKNVTTMRWLRRIFWKSITSNFDLQSVYINTKCNIICDSLSRLDSYKSCCRIRDADVAQCLCCHEIFNR